MDNKEIPKGELFSRIYIERGEPQRDSKRFRNRLGKRIESIFAGYSTESISNFIEYETGAHIEDELIDFFNSADLRDVLDSITLIWKYIKRVESSFVPASKWHVFVSRVLKEENLGYMLDEKCGVHYFVDEEFERNRIAVLACLQDTRYAAVAEAFERAHESLGPSDIDTKGAIRAVFDALEISYKLIVPPKEKDRLNSSGVRNKLIPMAQKIYNSDITASKTSVNLLSGFCDWIDAAHMYRHSQRSEEPVAPPMEIAILMVSSGASYLRWLVGFEKAVHQK